MIAGRQIRKFFLILLCLAAGIKVYAETRPESRLVDLRAEYSSWPVPPDITSEAAILIEAGTREILYGKNAQKTLYPASLTKILTALIALEECDPEESVILSHKAVADLIPGGRDSRYCEGMTFTVRDAVYAMCLDSSNSAAYALAEHIDGSAEKFAGRMNRRAAELGAEHTHFTNPHGLNDSQHVTTAEDLALILLAASENPEYCRIASEARHKITDLSENRSIECVNLHRMLNEDSQQYDPDVVLGKTGYTIPSGNTLATCAYRDGIKLICIVLQADRNGHVYEDTRKLLDYGFENFYLEQNEAKAAVARPEASVLDSIPAGHVQPRVLPKTENAKAEGSSQNSSAVSYEQSEEGSCASAIEVQTEENSIQSEYPPAAEVPNGGKEETAAAETTSGKTPKAFLREIQQYICDLREQIPGSGRLVRGSVKAEYLFLAAGIVLLVLSGTGGKKVRKSRQYDRQLEARSKREQERRLRYGREEY